MKPRYPSSCPYCQYLSENGDYSLYLCLEEGHHYWDPDDVPLVVVSKGRALRWSMPACVHVRNLTASQRRARVLAVGRRLITKCLLDRRVT